MDITPIIAIVATAVVVLGAGVAAGFAAGRRSGADTHLELANKTSLLQETQRELHESGQRVVGLQEEVARTSSVLRDCQQGLRDSQRCVVDLQASNGDLQSQLVRASTLLDQRDEQFKKLSSDLTTVRAARDAARKRLSATENRLAQVEAQHEARTEELERAETKLNEKFRSIATTALRENNEAFLQQAREQLDGQRQLGVAELEKQKDAIGAVMGPVQAGLQRLDEHTRAMERRRVGDSERLTAQLESLSRVTGNLNETLRSPNLRGQWAEQQLANILELSGMHQRIDFDLQRTIPVAGGNIRPDAIVRVPPSAKVVIDAKAPLDSYLRAQEAVEGSVAQTAITAHATALEGHAKALGRRNYDTAVGGSPDFVLMFVPADPILDAAMKVRPTLWEEAWSQHKVLIATPGTLLAFLRTVALAWQQHDMHENALAIAALGKELFNRLNIFTSHVRKVGASLEKAVTAYNQGVGSLERRVLPQARRFTELGAVAETATPVPELARVERQVREPSNKRAA